MTLTTFEDLAVTIDYPLLEPCLTTAEVVEGLQRARQLGVIGATVRPCDIDVAARNLAGSPVRPASVCAFPHGSATTAVKIYETRDLLRRGAREIDLVVTVSQLLSREFQHVQTELSQISELCHKEGALLKVVLETAYLTDELKIIACRCCERAEVDLVAAATGFGPAGYTIQDVKLLRKYLPEEIGIKAAGGLETLDQLLEAHDAGCARFGTSAAATILAEWKARLAAAESAQAIEPAG